ncbi:flippase-like domain-containing protein [Acidianus sp. HS-5]|uniref:flippase-like domain-containing protein n=1 Tax=Acidianus sp. HS-5 TaxID=2886040 RepID=UPI001F407CE9|nr:flippase-like domain-containing protein [Acidianus sp. HS-5]
MNWKNIITVILPFLALLIYSLIFHVNIILALDKINYIVILSFLTAYILQMSIIALRDKYIAEVSYKNAFKARLFGNASSLLIPGWAGQELARAAIYNLEKKNLIESLSLSIAEAPFDVISGAILFIAILPLKFYYLEFLYILVALGNIVGWSIGITYVYSTAGKHVETEKRLMRLIKIDQYYFLLLQGKDSIKNSIGNKKFTMYMALSFLGYLVLSAGLYPLIPNYFYDVLVTMAYFAATLFPIPGASGVSELALAIVIPSSYVFDIVILEYASYALGSIFLREISFSELKKDIDKIKKDGELYKRADP